LKKYLLNKFGVKNDRNNLHTNSNRYNIRFYAVDGGRWELKMENKYEGVVYGLLPEEEKEKLRITKNGIQYLSNNNGAWESIGAEFAKYFSPGVAYREKPEPKPKKWVQWESQDIKPGMAVKNRGGDGWLLITWVNYDRVALNGKIELGYQELFDTYVQYHSGDPCGKYIEDDSN